MLQEPADRHRCGSVDYQDFHISESARKIGTNINIICNTDNRELKQRRFGEMYVNQKWGLFPFNLPKRYQNCTAEFPFSYKEDLPKIWVKPLPKDSKSPLPVYLHWRAPLKKRLCLSSLLYIFWNWVIFIVLICFIEITSILAHAKVQLNQAVKPYPFDVVKRRDF